VLFLLEVSPSPSDLWHSVPPVAERRLTNSERRLRRITAEEPESAQRGILELFGEEEPEELDEDAPLAREGDDSAA
jgi:hypothetical protein